jgi:membrane-associated phospholipid phosphatase
MESAILTWIHGLSSPWLDVLFRFSHEIGTLSFCGVLVVVMALWHLARGERLEAVIWVVVGLLAGLLPELVKVAVGRGRPALWPSLVTVAGTSFPSGHATAGTALYPLLGWMALRSRPAMRVAGYGAGLAVGLYIGVGRLYLGVHWPSDVVAGWLLGVTMSACAVWWLEHRRARASSGA